MSIWRWGCQRADTIGAGPALIWQVQLCDNPACSVVHSTFIDIPPDIFNAFLQHLTGFALQLLGQSLDFQNWSNEEKYETKISNNDVCQIVCYTSGGTPLPLGHEPHLIWQSFSGDRQRPIFWKFCLLTCSQRLTIQQFRAWFWSCWQSRVTYQMDCSGFSRHGAERFCTTDM